MQQELAGARAKLLAARAEVQRLQVRGIMTRDSRFAVDQVSNDLHSLQPMAHPRVDCCKSSRMRHVQISVAREHEARQVAERGLMEAHAGVMPVSATHELALQVCRGFASPCHHASAQLSARCVTVHSESAGLAEPGCDHICASGSR